MRIRLAGISHPGHVRQRNDDHYCVGPFIEQEACTTLTLDTSSTLFRHYGVLAAVADGMGHYTGSDVASRVVLETLSAQFYGERHDGCTPTELHACLSRYLEQCRHVLRGVLERTPAYHDAGTTLAGIALLAPELAAVFHIGDSRVLGVSAGYVRPLTIDHTPVGPDVAAGRLSEAEALTVPAANQLARSLGRLDAGEVEWNDVPTLHAGEQFLLGTDGWHGLGRGLSRKAIQEIARQGLDAEAMVRVLLAEALRADGQDNVTVVGIQLMQDEQQHGR
ncbi:MAG TPA: PP2C family serine/threonine-protein phosphatase [Armatimonadota bacterium]|jgi:protein phosphatase